MGRLFSISNCRGSRIYSISISRVYDLLPIKKRGTPLLEEGAPEEGEAFATLRGLVVAVLTVLRHVRKLETAGLIGYQLHPEHPRHLDCLRHLVDPGPARSRVKVHRQLGGTCEGSTHEAEGNEPIGSGEPFGALGLRRYVPLPVSTAELDTVNGIALNVGTGVSGVVPTVHGEVESTVLGVIGTLMPQRAESPGTVQDFPTDLGGLVRQPYSIGGDQGIN